MSAKHPSVRGKLDGAGGSGSNSWEPAARPWSESPAKPSFALRNRKKTTWQFSQWVVWDKSRVEQHYRGLLSRVAAAACSLGRQPQEWTRPEAKPRQGRQRSASPGRCRPFGACSHPALGILGLSPQATRCRRCAAAATLAWIPTDRFGPNKVDGQICKSLGQSGVWPLLL